MKLLLAALLCSSAWAQVDFAPHNMTSETSPPPLVVSASSYRIVGAEKCTPHGAFDGVLTASACSSSAAGGNLWQTNGTPTGWISVDFGAGNTHKAKWFGLIGDPYEPGYYGRAPTSFTLQGSNDGGSTWSVLATLAGEPDWGTGEKRVYLSAVSNTAYRQFKLDVTAVAGAETYMWIGEIFLYRDSTPGEAFSPNIFPMKSNSVPAPFAAACSTAYSGWYQAYEAFDGENGLNQSWIGTNGGVDWLRLDLGAGNAKALGSYKIKAQSAATGQPTDRLPKNWTMEGSNDASSWTVLDTRSNQTGWAGGEERTYAASSPAAFRYFRLNITANNGNADGYTQIGELTLIEGTITARGGSYAAVM